MFCDVNTFGVPATVEGAQVLISKWVKTEECLKREFVDNLRGNMHDTVNFRFGLRPWQNR